jgi:cellulose synthase/poly-beta-1,6-N-acetylglucosamine synthase-like glycosyltransferase
MTAEIPAGPPVATIITVSDHKVGEAESWDDLRETWRALARQDFKEPVEFLLVETEGRHRDIPEDVLHLLPGVRVVQTEGTTSFDLKNAGAEAASTDFVVILDADCTPHPGWWRAVIEHHKRHPEAAVISGRTVYKGEGLLPKIFAVIDRTYVDSGRAGPTMAISNNNAGFARQILLDHPFGNEVGPFGSEPHGDRIKASGATLHFEPGMVVSHGFGGWPMERAERRHIGFSMTRYRQLNAAAARSWMVRHSWIWIPFTILMSTAADVRRSIRVGGQYGLRWFQLPLVWLCSIRAHLMEIPGILLALRGGWIGHGGGYR